MNSANHQHQDRRNDARKDKPRTSVLSFLGRKLTRLTGLRIAREKPAAVETDWRAIISGEAEQTCPVPVFRELSEKLRLAGDLGGADRICERGIRIYPDNLWLAMIHAKIADSIDDSELRVIRWQRVVELGGDTSASKAFKNLADAHYARGDFPAAEAVVRRGMALYPEDFHLAERLGKISYAAGFTARAVEQWLELIRSHPQNNSATIHLRIGEAYCQEGMFERAEAILSEGLARFPEDARLATALSELRFSMRDHSLTPEKQPSTNESFTSHLLREKVEPFGRGKVSLPFYLNEANQHIPAMLDFEECIAPLRDVSLAPQIDVFTTWGATDFKLHNFARRMAADQGKPLLCLEYGFISSLGLAINNSPMYSVIICPDSIYFDATRPTCLESKLNSSDYRITNEQTSRSANCMAKIVKNRITKYNHAPQIDLRARFPANGRKRILLVDQRFGDNSVEKGLGGELTFQRMFETALRMPDHDILVKLHPDSISGGQGSYLERLVPRPLPQNITVIDFDVNPFCLFEVVDKVFVCTSQLGFEALMAEKEVHCFGVPFYAGWGLTNDRMAIPRRKRSRTILEIFHLFYIKHSRYFSPSRGVAEIEDLIDYLIESKTSVETSKSCSGADEGVPVPVAETLEGLLKILIILPSGRLGASGRYIQNLAWSLCRLGCQVMVLAEGSCPPTDNGVSWLTLKFEGSRLATSVRETITAFAPHIIYENGVRSRAQRAALEAMLLTNARLAMQSEDDDVQVFETHHGKSAADALTLLDMPALQAEDITGFLQQNNWRHSANVLLDPEYDRWVEPVMRMLCYRLASLHTAIWHPFAERLAQEYAAPTLVVPPVASAADFERLLLSAEERGRILRKYEIDPDHVVFFIGGALYGYSDEYAIFLAALNQTVVKTGRPIALVVSSSRSSLPVARMAYERLLPEITVADLGRAEDTVYMEMLKACDVVCSPGLPDRFNRYRLPSRLVKAMAMAKPVLTCRCGFGESLEHNGNAFLMDGDDPVAWADSIAPCLIATNRERVGKQGLLFARENFCSDQVAAALKRSFESILAEAPRSLAAGINISRSSLAVESGLNPRPGIKLRNRNHSTLRPVIPLLAMSTYRLDTVVHVGAGKCGEIQDYSQLGARKVLLVEGSPGFASRLRELENIDGTLVVKEAVVSANGGSQPVFVKRNTARSEQSGEICLLRPLPDQQNMGGIAIEHEEVRETFTLGEICADFPLESGDHLLALELDGAEADVLTAALPELLQKFRWIATRIAERPLYENATTQAALEEILTKSGFEPIVLPPNYTDLMTAVLYQRKEF